MKTLKMLYIALIALVAGAFSSCTNDFEPGPKVEGPEVSFAADNVSSVDFTGDPKEGTQKLVLSRVDTKEELEVCIITEIERGLEKLFSIPETVTFAAGEDTAELVYTVNYANFASGKTYSVNFLIADEMNNLTTPYGFSEWKVSYALNPWRKLKDPKGNDAKGKFRGLSTIDVILQGFDTSIEIDINVYKHVEEEKYMIKEPWVELIRILFLNMGVEGITADDVKMAFSYTAQNLIIDCTDPNNVILPLQSMGLNDVNNFWDENTCLGDFYYQATGGSFEDGVITFPKGGITCTCGYYRGVGIPDDDPDYCQGSNSDGTFRLILPGYEAADYSLSVAYDGMDVAADNKTVTAKFAFNYGDDVTGVKYLIVKGNDEPNAANLIKTIVDGTDENILSIEDFVKGGDVANLKIQLEKGVYTIAAAPLDKNGEIKTRNAVVKSFYFAGLGDTEDHSCVLGCFMAPASEAVLPEYQEKYPDYCSIAYCIYGEELKRCKFLLTDTATANAFMSYYEMTLEELVESQGLELTGEYLDAACSEEGFTSVANTFESDTEYILAAVATNVYDESKFISTTYTTPSMPYDGELVLGDYYMYCYLEDVDQNGNPVSAEFDNTFRVRPVIGSTTELTIKDFAFEDGISFYASYDAEASKVTISGIAVGDEETGCIFGNAYNQYGNYYYGIFSYASADSKKGNDPVVLSVDPETKKINGLETLYIEVPALVPNSEGKLSPVGSFKAFTSGETVITPVADLAGGKEDAATFARSNKSVARVPFSSIKIDKKLVAPTIKSVKFVDNSNILKAVNKSVKPISIERYTPAPRRITLAKKIAR